MQMSFPTECRFAHYTQDKEGNDFVLIKEQVHHPELGLIPNLKTRINPKRPYYVTKKGRRDHKDKKEWEKTDALERYDCRQSDLTFRAARSLGMPFFKGSLRDLHASPYIYGTDISITSLIKQEYTQAYVDSGREVTAYSVAAIDTEVDVVQGTNQIIISTISFKNMCRICVQKAWVEGYHDPKRKILEAAEKNLKDVIDRRKLEIEVFICDTEIDVVLKAIEFAHTHKPDFLAVWNIEYDMNKFIEACERAKLNPADVFSDPSVPPEFRHFYFKVGPAKKTTASGKVMVFKPAQRWHGVRCPASFMWVDAMCGFRHIRNGSAEEPSYGLDAILTKVFKGKLNKLKTQEAQHLKGLQWHQYMQAFSIINYCSYAILDPVSMNELDEATFDLKLSLPMFAQSTDFENFNSQPKRLADALHHFCLKRNLVIGTTSGDMVTEFDADVTSLDGWITMLPAQNVADTGLRIITENPYLPTNIRIHFGDLDVAASYPNGEVVFNISKETTLAELISIAGVSEIDKRMATINLSAGHVNALEVTHTLYGFPTLDEWEMAFAQDHGLAPGATVIGLTIQ